MALSIDHTDLTLHRMLFHPSLTTAAMRIPYLFQNLSTNPLLYQALAPRQTTIDAGNTTWIPTGALPPSQALCDSPIYCPGPLLQAVQLAGIYPDSKTFGEHSA